MTGLEALQSVQFVGVKGKPIAMLSYENWQVLIEWLETLEDVQVCKLWEAMPTAGFAYVLRLVG